VVGVVVSEYVPVVPVSTVPAHSVQYNIGYALGYGLVWVFVITLVVLAGTLVWVWWSQRGKKKGG
jgi:hypothetical protein